MSLGGRGNKKKQNSHRAWLACAKWIPWWHVRRAAVGRIGGDSVCAERGAWAPKKQPGCC